MDLTKLSREELIREILEIREINRGLIEKYSDNNNSTMTNEIQKIEKDLIKSKERLESFINSTGNVILLISQDYNIIEFNEKAEIVYEYRKDEVIGKNYLELFIPLERREDVKAEIDRVFAGIPSDEYENPIISRGGNEYTLIWNAQRLPDIEGEIPCIISCGQNITKRKLAEEQLKIFRQFIEASNQGFGIGTMEGKINYANSALCELIGVNNYTDLYGKSFTLFYDEDSSNKLFKEIIPDVLEKGKWSGELAIKSLDNRIILTSEDYFPIYLKGQTKPFIAVVVTNITERKNNEKELDDYRNNLEKKVEFRTEELKDINQQLQSEINIRKTGELALKASEAKFRILAESSPVSISIMNQANYLYTNNAWRDLTGYSDEESITLNPQEIIHPDMKDIEWNRITDRLVGEEVPKRYELKIINKNGQILWCDHTAVNIFYEGKITILSVDLDITEYKNTQLELTHANNMKELLLDVITHDLKNPANVIYNGTDLFENGTPEPELLKTIKEASAKLIKVVNDASMLAKITEHNQIEMNNIPICEIVKEALDECRPIFDSYKVELLYDCKIKCYVSANNILSQVFKNYLNNVIKYASEGGKALVEIIEENEYVIVKVKDFGTTISEEKRKLVFERGIQLKDKNKTGRGLGLSISKRIAESHKGEVWVEPNLPTGNTFCLKLPRVEKD